jgi:hypothetical protein
MAKQQIDHKESKVVRPWLHAPETIRSILAEWSQGVKDWLSPMTEIVLDYSLSLFVYDYQSRCCPEGGEGWPEGGEMCACGRIRLIDVFEGSVLSDHQWPCNSEQAVDSLEVISTTGELIMCESDHYNYHIIRRYRMHALAQSTAASLSPFRTHEMLDGPLPPPPPTRIRVKSHSTIEDLLYSMRMALLKNKPWPANVTFSRTCSFDKSARQILNCLGSVIDDMFLMGWSIRAQCVVTIEAHTMVTPRSSKPEESNSDAHSQAYTKIPNGFTISLWYSDRTSIIWAGEGMATAVGPLSIYMTEDGHYLVYATQKKKHRSDSDAKKHESESVHQEVFEENKIEIHIFDIRLEREVCLASLPSSYYSARICSVVERRPPPFPTNQPPNQSIELVATVEHLAKDLSCPVLATWCISFIPAVSGFSSTLCCAVEARTKNFRREWISGARVLGSTISPSTPFVRTTNAISSFIEMKARDEKKSDTAKVSVNMDTTVDTARRSVDVAGDNPSAVDHLVPEKLWFYELSTSSTPFFHLTTKPISEIVKPIILTVHSKLRSSSPYHFIPTDQFTNKDSRDFAIYREERQPGTATAPEHDPSAFLIPVPNLCLRRIHFKHNIENPVAMFYGHFSAVGD